VIAAWQFAKSVVRTLANQSTDPNVSTPASHASSIRDGVSTWANIPLVSAEEGYHDASAYRHPAASDLPLDLFLFLLIPTPNPDPG
jgi:hypothetical protein